MVLFQILYSLIISSGCREGRSWWPQGKALGGSSVINFMVAARGNHIDYDRWAALGNQGWSFEEVLPYFKKLEDFGVKIADSGFHSKGGYLPINDVQHRTDAAKAFVEAAQEIGFPYVDYNGKNQLGVMF